MLPRWKNNLGLRFVVLVVAFVLCFPSSLSWASVHKEETLMDGTRYKTTAYIQTAEENSLPVVLILGGVHGSEPAGSAAAEKMKELKIKKGTLIVVPRVNNLALKNGVRTLPEIGDIARAFPGRENGTPSEQMAFQISDLMKRYKVTMLIDMHEAISFSYHDKTSLGQSILPATNMRSRELAGVAVVHINKSLEKVHEKYVVKRSGPVAGSAAYSAGQFYNATAFTLETSKKQPLQERVRQHVAIASLLITEEGIEIDTAQ